jgi:polysaccharide pyruvyl transferase WcaK-like protein
MPFIRAKIPVFVSGQTVGPLGVNGEHDKLAKEIIEGVDILTVRDRKYSREYIEKIGARPKKLVETMDDATHVKLDMVLPVRLPPVKKAAVNVTVYTYDTQPKAQAIDAICHQLVCMGYLVLLVPHHEWDLKALRELDVPGTQVIDTTGWHGITTKRLFSECEVVIGGRYHVVVFAMSAGIPCVGMAGNHYSWIKQHGFADQCGIGDRIVPPDKVTDVEFTMEKVREAAKSDRSYIVPESDSFPLFKEWIQGTVLT